MNRSQFLRLSLGAAAAVTAGGLSLPAWAAAPIVEGKDYLALKAAQPVEGHGKIVVTEFFWYACPHCFELEPTLVAWVKKLPKDVHFQLSPVAFRDDLLPHSQIYFALDALGKVDELHDKVFNAIHVQHKRMLKEDEIADWMAQQGIDRAKFVAAFRSFGVNAKARAANKMADDYRLDGVPTLAVQGRYLTSPSIAGSIPRTIEVLDALIAQERRKK